MLWLVVDEDEREWASEGTAVRGARTWENEDEYSMQGWVNLPKGSIKKLIGRDLTWADEPVEIEG